MITDKIIKKKTNEGNRKDTANPYQVLQPPVLIIFLNNFTSYKYKALTAPVIVTMIEKFRGSLVTIIMAIGPNL